MENKHSVYEILDLTPEEKEWFMLQEKVSHLIIDIMDRRYELKMSQRELAKRTGIKQPMIARIERFDATPRIDTLIKMCNALGLKIVIEKEDGINKSTDKNNAIIYNGKEYQQNNYVLNEEVERLKRLNSNKKSSK